jgi:hypothetical protein
MKAKDVIRTPCRKVAPRLTKLRHCRSLFPFLPHPTVSNNANFSANRCEPYGTIMSPLLAPFHSFNRDAEGAAAHRSPPQRASPADTDAERGPACPFLHGDRPRQSTLAAGVRWA